jgi:hypothetical protein
MPLIKPRAHRVRTLRHIARLQEPNRQALFQYARFIEETPDYVLNQLIETVLAKDRDFVNWRAEQETTSGAAESSTREHDAKTRSDASGDKASAGSKSRSTASTEGSR